MSLVGIFLIVCSSTLRNIKKKSKATIYVFPTQLKQGSITNTLDAANASLIPSRYPSLSPGNQYPHCCVYPSLLSLHSETMLCLALLSLVSQTLYHPVGCLLG